MNKSFLSQRKEITILDISHQDLKGELDLSEFSNSGVIICRSNNLTNLTVNNCPQLEAISCSQNNLASLQFSNLSKLKTLNCWENKSLTNLDLSNNKLLSYLSFYNNKLIDLNFLTQLNPNNLTHLNMGGNKFPESDLSVFSHLVNLEELYCWGNPLKS